MRLADWQQFAAVVQLAAKGGLRLARCHGAAVGVRETVEFAQRPLEHPADIERQLGQGGFHRDSLGVKTAIVAWAPATPMVTSQVSNPATRWACGNTGSDTA